MILFNAESNASNNPWIVVDDAVMGGKSAGAFAVNESGHGVFHGFVSLENNGGFSSVRQRFPAIALQDFTCFKLHMKGDGNPYQFRVKASAADSFSYVYVFQTTGEWQTLEIPFDEMYPAFRGNKLSMPNYPGQLLEEIAFLVGNKKAVSFKLEIAELAVSSGRTASPFNA